MKYGVRVRVQDGDLLSLALKLFTFFLIGVMAFGCSNRCVDEWHSTHLIHDFYLEWELQPKSQHVTIGSWNCGVGGNEPITDQGIYAVGYDSSFIIAKLHPDKTGSVNALNTDKSKTTYYIISIKDYPIKWKTGENVTVYDELNSFLKARQELGVSNKLEFDIVTEELE
jgi:hypothetical protein